MNSFTYSPVYYDTVDKMTQALQDGTVDAIVTSSQMVEDNELNAEIAQMLLESEGAMVTVVGNGQKAVEIFNEKEEGTFDAILMDLMMPVMDGLSATRKIRAMNRTDARTIPIIAITANAFEEDEQKCMNAGMTAHLTKPLNIEIVKQTLYEQVKAIKKVHL